MWNPAKTNPRCLCRLLVVVLSVAVLGQCKETRDFVAVNTLGDGEVETRVFYKGVSAKEVTVGKGPTLEKWKRFILETFTNNLEKTNFKDLNEFLKTENDIKFRQIANKGQLLQLIYNDGENLKDCEIVHQRSRVKEFLDNFKNDLSNLVATSNVTIESLDNRSLPEEIRTWFNFTRLKHMCKKLHREMKNEVLEMKNHQNRSAQRQKRSIFIAPGTLWCGDSHNARHYTELGVLSNTDKCCRRHDHCKRIIPGFTTKFHYHNYSPFSLSHCHCDQSFRACLKMVDTSDANLVGKLFFNVVQTKCFVIKPKKVCVKSSWWGQCEKYKHIKQAILRDNLPY